MALGRLRKSMPTKHPNYSGQHGILEDGENKPPKSRVAEISLLGNREPY